MWVPAIGQLMVAGLTLVSEKRTNQFNPTQPTWLSELETLVLKGGKKKKKKTPNLLNHIYIYFINGPTLKWLFLIITTMHGSVLKGPLVFELFHFVKTASSLKGLK
jgi:hypothetical protein